MSYPKYVVKTGRHHSMHARKEREHAGQSLLAPLGPALPFSSSLPSSGKPACELSDVSKFP